MQQGASVGKSEPFGQHFLARKTLPKGFKSFQNISQMSPSAPRRSSKNPVNLTHRQTERVSVLRWQRPSSQSWSRTKRFVRFLELINTSDPLSDWDCDLGLQIITFLVEKHSHKVLRKLPVSSRNVSKLPPGDPRGPPWSPSGPLRPLLACSGVLGDRFRDARGPTRTTENLCFPRGIQ